MLWVDFRSCAVQISVSGIQYGAWGLRQYGPKPMRVDALRFYVDHLKALLPKIQEVQRERGTPQERVVPTAFVTFRSRKAQVGAQPRGSCHLS